MKQNKRILVIDDSEVVAGCVTDALEQAEFTVIRATNGLEGIEKAYKELPDLILMDIEMPVMDGFQATRFLKSRKGISQIPLIVHTTLSDDRDRNWALACGADAFFVKDFEQIERLVKAITTLSDHEPYKGVEDLREEAKNVTKESIASAFGCYFDRALFRSNTVNKLIEVNNHMYSLQQTIDNVSKVLLNACEYHVAVILMKYHKSTVSFSIPKDNVFQSDLKDFVNVCLSDFYERFSELSQEPIEEHILGIDSRTDFQAIRVDKEKIRAYTFFELKDAEQKVIGTIHFGHFTNNYYTEKLVQNIQALLPTTGTLISNALAYKQITEKEGKIRGVFSKFVPAEIIDSLIEKQDVSSLLVGEKRSIAVLFSDIRSFTTISEYNTAEAVVSCLNSYFDLMAQAIKAQGGIIDKFIGDAILAVFGAPTSYEDNAARAVRAAIGMINALPQLDTSKLKLPKTGFQIGVGIHEGIAIVGNIGSKEKFDYTVIGDTVNLASRLEGLTKHYGQQIIVSEAVKDKVAAELFVRELDVVKVKGKEQPTTMYGIPVYQRDAFTPNVIKDYEKALSMYKMQNWLTAIEYFQKVQKHLPNDHICNMYITRCQDYAKNPPPKDWDGAIELDFK
ncbi:MAG: hypothetical protein K0S74_1455 [Chlamydiales bacterium]|jgi:class 3 adenylate cyclase/CheY-like chemotaxis protein|nr:hypothetical protein [Chlamydiales bacterium]